MSHLLESKNSEVRLSCNLLAKLTTTSDLTCEEQKHVDIDIEECKLAESGDSDDQR